MQPSRERLDPTIAEIHRLLAETLPAGSEPFAWHCERGGIANLNSVLDLPEDDEFIYAAIWQLHGAEVPGRKRRKWQSRLQRTSRASVLVMLRYKVAGRRHAVRVPGLWWAFLLDPPGSAAWERRWGRLPTSRLRRWLVSWRYDVACAREHRQRSVGDKDPAGRRRAA